MTRLRMMLPFAFVLLLVGAALPAVLQAEPSSSTQTITVTVGTPHAASVKLSRSTITSSSAMFKVANKGKVALTFKVCTHPSATDKANSCTGVSTKKLAPGASGEVTVTLSTSGTYEYLSSTPSQAKSGLKGLVTVTLKPATSTTPASGATTTATTTTTPSSSTGGTGGGGVVNGQATDPACAAGTLIPVGPGAGDEDEDNEGGFATDGDGCL